VALNFRVSHGSATSFFKRNNKKYYIYFIDNLVLFPTVKKSFKIGYQLMKLSQKSSKPRFFLRHNVQTATLVCSITFFVLPVIELCLSMS